jgi:phosphoglycolate phosphatase-like HAD superfamily hydrolase
MTRYRYDAVVFDFDGTLVQSNEVKTRSFGKLYEKYGEGIVRQVAAYHEEYCGISRFVKFRYFHEHLLHLPYNDEVEKELAQAYSQLVFGAVVQAPYVEGIPDLLETFHQHLPLFVASGTPVNELREIITRRSMGHFFQKVFGSPATKTEILHSIIVDYSYSPERVLMVGDALADWEGAQNVGAGFIGIQAEEGKNIFPSTVPVLKNLETLGNFVIQN